MGAWPRHATPPPRAVGDPLLADCDALRVAHGENDGVPGLVIDVYAGTAVVVFDGAAAARSGARACPPCSPASRRRRSPSTARGCAACAARATTTASRSARRSAGALAIHERGARFEVDVRRGQKTGFFLDQRENRARIAAARRRRRRAQPVQLHGRLLVLAALGGARHVTSVDIAAPAIAAAERNVGALSGVDPRRTRA